MCMNDILSYYYSFGIDANGKFVSGVFDSEESLILTGETIHLNDETTVDSNFKNKN